jgi:hypothetical protein
MRAWTKLCSLDRSWMAPIQNCWDNAPQEQRTNFDPIGMNGRKYITRAVIMEELRGALASTLSFDHSAFSVLHSVLTKLLATQTPGEVLAEFCEFCPEGTIVECTSELAAVMGLSPLEQALEKAWSHLSERAKLNIAMSAGVPNTLTDNFWRDVFADSSNTVHVRHRIAAGLSRSQSPDTQTMLPSLLSEIGRYDDAQRQAVLDDFIRNCSR